MQAAYLLLLAVISANPSDDYPSAAAKTTKSKSMSAAISEESLYHLPPCYDGTRSLPVVLVYHGKSASPKW